MNMLFHVLKLNMYIYLHIMRYIFFYHLKANWQLAHKVALSLTIKGLVENKA